jgi:hypothetical protein
MKSKNNMDVDIETDTEEEIRTYALLYKNKEVGRITKDAGDKMFLKLQCYFKDIWSYSDIDEYMEDFVSRVITTKYMTRKCQDAIIDCTDGENEITVHFKNSFSDESNNRLTEIRIYHQIIGLVCTCKVDNTNDITDTL